MLHFSNTQNARAAHSLWCLQRYICMLIYWNNGMLYVLSDWTRYFQWTFAFLLLHRRRRRPRGSFTRTLWRAQHFKRERRARAHKYLYNATAWATKHRAWHHLKKKILWKTPLPPLRNTNKYIKWQQNCLFVPSRLWHRTLRKKKKTIWQILCHARRRNIKWIIKEKRLKTPINNKKFFLTSIVTYFINKKKFGWFGSCKEHKQNVFPPSRSLQFLSTRARKKMQATHALE